MKEIRRFLTAKTGMLAIHSAIVLAISYVIAAGLMLSSKSLSFFAVLDESGDVPMSDMYLFINSRKGPVRLNRNITLVSIDSCKDRAEIARVIELVDSLQPKVIGLDVFFRNRIDPGADTILENVIRKCKNRVVACILDDEQRDDNDVYNICYRYFFVGPEDSLTEGFINLDSDGNSTVRTFTPQLFLPHDTLYCFAAQIVRVCNETAFDQLIKRDGNQELINFEPLLFYDIDRNEIEDNPEWITDKIVLIGSLSGDLHPTPTNPQMRGMDIHAHIILTILNEKFIKRLDNVWTKLLNLILCYLFSIFCWIATTRFKKGVAILIKLTQVAILLLALLAGYYLFTCKNIDVAYTRSIIVMGVLILTVDIYNVCIIWGSKYILKRKNIKSK